MIKHTSKLAGVFLLHGPVMQETRRNRRVNCETVEHVRRATPFLWQTQNEDADDCPGKLDHLGLVSQNNVLKVLSREIRPQIWAGEEATRLRIIRGNFSADNKCLEPPCQHVSNKGDRKK